MTMGINHKRIYFNGCIETETSNMPWVNNWICDSYNTKLFIYLFASWEQDIIYKDNIGT